MADPHDPPARAILGAAIRDALAEQADRTHPWLGAEIAAAEGRRNPYSASMVGSWLRGERDMSPTQVFAAEQALGMRPGTLSRLLGYVPADTAPARTVPDAIAAEDRLTELAALLGDGTLSTAEWEVARGPARRRATAARTALANLPVTDNLDIGEVAATWDTAALGLRRRVIAAFITRIDVAAKTSDLGRAWMADPDSPVRWRIEAR